jgi:hypothetical protein
MQAQANTLAAAISAAWGGGISTLVGDLQSGDIIPNASGLAGAQDFTQADIADLAGYAVNISNPANSSQGTGGYNGSFIAALFVKAAGINATISGPTS